MKRTRIAYRSEKKAATDAVLAVNREVVLSRSGMRCQANTPGCPSGPHAGTTVHHVLPRSHASKDTVHDLDNLLVVCCAFDYPDGRYAGAHEWIHAHPTLSYENGWLRRSWE